MKKFAKIGCLKKVYHYFWQKKRDRQSVEKHVVKSSGIENDKMIYIIRRVEKCGFFSNYFFVLGHIIYALNNNYIPVVDMENYTTLYSEYKELHGTKNAWEYYFYQPTGEMPLECAYKSKEYILSSGLYQYDLVPYYTGKPGQRRFPTADIVSYLNPYVREYMKIKPEYIEEAELTFNKFGGGVQTNRWSPYQGY